MLFKMLLIERSHYLMPDTTPRPRQVFVTKSRMLAKKVQEFYERLSDSLVQASRTLDDLRGSGLTLDQDVDGALVDVDDDTEWRGDLPVRFSDLDDQHFPLFITYDGLCDLLDGDIRGNNSKPKNSKDAPPKPMITFEHFVSTYWPRFSEATRKGLGG